MDEIPALARRVDLQFVQVLSVPPVGWVGAAGSVDTELLRPLIAAGGRHREAFVCGPDGMMAAVEAALLRCGLPQSKIHMERFHLV
jgi:ferredoxin-NADP reductase